MKSLIRWSINNTPAMNTLMVGVLVVGGISLFTMRREIFPEFDLEIIVISVPYPGATPDDVEKAICQRIEEAVSSIDGVKKQTSIAREGSGAVVLELEADVPDVQRTLNEVRSEIDQITSFPDTAEDPDVQQITLRRDAIRVGVIGPGGDLPGAHLRLREIAEQVRDELKGLANVSQANLVGARQYQIDIEISEDTLRKYGLTLQEVARIVRRENIEMPGGSMKTDSQEVLLRGKNKRMVGTEIAKIPLVTRPNGVVLTVGDLGTVRDEFTDTTAINRVSINGKNGQPAEVIAVEKTSSEDLLAIIADVQQYIEKKNKKLPEGYSLATWADQSLVVRDRLELLGRNGLQGIILVFLVLAVFLEIRLAFWVALGVPISILGACIVLLYSGQTLNMLSMFAFLMALGILVDDAIVVGENVYAHRQRGSGVIKAAVEGTVEVLPSVIASVTTTIIAFAPLLFVPGVIGKFVAVMPLAIIAMLLISLFEVTFILPCHLAHNHGQGGSSAVDRYCRNMPGPLRNSLGILIQSVAFTLTHMLYPLRRLGHLFDWLNGKTDRLLSWFIDGYYLPALRWSLHNPATVVSVAVTILVIFAGLVKGQIVPFVFFPKLDSNMIQASISYPDGTPASITDAATKRMEEAILEIDAKYAKIGMPLKTLIHRAVGTSPEVASPLELPSGDSNAGGVMVELVEPSERNISSQELIDQWRNAAGEFPGAESVSFGSQMHGPGGKPIEFKLLQRGDDMTAMEDLTEKCKAKLKTFPGVSDVADDSRPGKWEILPQIREKARAMGLQADDLHGTVRASYYGEEVMRLQRGRHEVKLMVRYPRDERRSLANFNDIRIRSGGTELPLTELADVEVQRGYSVINRMDQLRSITITADVDSASGANAKEIVEAFKETFLAKTMENPKYVDIQIRWEGQAEQTKESLEGLAWGLGISLIAMFGLLTFEFRSYFQPLLILAVIPFGAVGAIVGHLIMRLDVTIFSLFGMVALSGVVINDSIVLIDFINRRVRDGVPVKEALMDAGSRRFRPVLLTSITTVAGLLPLLTETSLQAQVLIPMATSLCFGLMFSTVLILILVPSFYQMHAVATSTAAGGNAGGPDTFPQ